MQETSRDKLLFHYTSQTGLLGIIEEKAIWATNILYLNDGAELRYAAGLAHNEIRELRKSLRGEDIDFLNEVEHKLTHITEYDGFGIFVCSFSKNGDQLSQWRGYCPHGGGFSIGFDFLSPMYAHVEKQGFSLFDCEYDTTRQEEYVRQLLTQSLTEFHTLQETDHYAPVKAAKWFEYEFLKVAPILKHPKFGEEQESRLISVITSFSRQVHFRVGTSTLIPYFKLQLGKECRDLAFPEIIVGPTPYPDLSIDATKGLLEVKGIEGCSVKCSEIPFRPSW